VKSAPHRFSTSQGRSDQVEKAMLPTISSIGPSLAA